MGMITTSDGTRIYYKDWGTGQPVVFSHGWPLNADAWDDQMFHVASSGYRAIAHDRRGHGRSDQPWTGNDMDTYADDLAALIETLGLHDAVLVGHSTGGAEVARYIGRHGSSRVAKAVLLGATVPLIIKTGANPDGAPAEAFDAIRADQVHLAPAEPVAERTADQQERGQRQDVAGHHPLQAGDARVELTPDGRQGDVDDRGVDRRDPE